MDLKLAGHVALVTGSTSGIGYATARRLALEGAQVVVNGRDAARTEAAVDRLRDELRATGASDAERVTGIAADLGTADGCAQLVADIGAIDILVNNLGIFEPKPFESIPDSDWLRFFETNVMSGVRLARAFLPAMKAADWGRIVFVSSESGICPPPEMVHYGMTKSAQLSVSRGIAETCAGTGVTVNSVLPGPTLTEGVRDFIGTLAREQGLSFDDATRAFFKDARPTSLLRRFIEPDEVAALIAWVCSPISSATTGAALRADGGVVRSLV